MKTKNILKYSFITAAVTSAVLFAGKDYFLEASSHREAPMIANDPLADNTDLYAFRSPDDTNTVTIIANYYPFELPHGGPNYYTFGENVNYEIHIKNDTLNPGKDDITYRFTFNQTNEDSTTFFNIRKGLQNLKTTYTVEKSIKGGIFTPILTNAPVPPTNIGPRSIDDKVLGLGLPYETIMKNAIKTVPNGEIVFAGPVDDPFFVDLGGIFDLGQTRAKTGARDGLKKLNVHSIALKIPISMLQKSNKMVTQAKNILDGDFVIGVWASASRPKIKTLLPGGKSTESTDYVQVSRIGMPLTNEAVISIGSKDKWNSRTPYNESPEMVAFFTNPELALYMDDSAFGGLVPAFDSLRIQRTSLKTATFPGFNFNNKHDGLSALKTNAAAIKGTAFEKYGSILLQKGAPRSVDILPIFFTGVPNARPYQLATGKNGDPLAAGKPFINNFLPTLGDMLRLNMAVPVTPRTSKDFSSEGLLAAAVLGLTDPRFANPSLQFIPNMDGFPNGRRLEDDVTRIELQAVSGVVLAAIGLWYDDYKPSVSASPVTKGLTQVLHYTTGVEKNDTTFKTAFPYLQTPWRGYNAIGAKSVITAIDVQDNGGLNLSAPEATAFNYPNPFTQSTTIKFRTPNSGKVVINIVDATGRLVTNLVNEDMAAGTYEQVWNADNAKDGMYYATIYSDKKLLKTVKMQVKQK